MREWFNCEIIRVNSLKWYYKMSLGGSQLGHSFSLLTCLNPKSAAEKAASTFRIEEEEDTLSWVLMAVALKATSFLQLKKHNHSIIFRPNSHKLSLSVAKSFKLPMATLSTVPTVGLSETFTRLKQQGKVSLLP